jgi:TolB-like protein/Flp pilus assembly protein TadD
MSSRQSFFAELKRRNVYKVAVAYAVVGWLLVQVASIVFPTFDAPPAALKILMVLLAVGFPIALAFSWAFEITSEGVKRESEVEADQSITHHTGRKMVTLTVVLAAIAGGLLAFQLLGSKRSPSMQKNVTAESAGPIPEKSIAVLPFDNLSSDKENAFFADGVQDEILTDLAKIADLKVISRTSVMQYRDTPKRNLPEIAQALKVAHILEGSVQRASNHVRVNAQLIDARSDAHLWAQRFDGDLADVFAIQTEIAQKIADQLQAVLSPKEQAALAAKPTTDAVAYDLYLRAKEIEHNSTAPRMQQVQERVRLLEEAVARDPAFVPALCLLARARLEAYWFNYDHTDARLNQAKTTIDAAARLQPDEGEVHFARALLCYWGNRDYAPALTELGLAQRSLPNDSDVRYFIGAVERRQGHWAESTRHMEEALKLDPRNLATIFELVSNYNAGKRYSDAARVLEDALRWKPKDFFLESARAAIDRQARADLGPTQTVVFGDLSKTATQDQAAAVRLFLAFDQRDFAAAKKALADYKGPDFPSTGFITTPKMAAPREMYEGQIAQGFGDTAAAQSAFLNARERAAAMVAMRPDDAKALSILGYIDARLGRKDDAVREGARATELLPVEKDSLDGPMILGGLATIYVRAGQPDRALDVLERVAAMPCGPSYGELKLNEDWDSLRSNPRFQKLLASLGPKDVAAAAK